MSRGRWLLTVALCVGLGLGIGCGGGGGGGGKSPFPPAVRNLFDDLDDALRSGNQDLPLTLTCGVPVQNPMENSSDLQMVDVAGMNNHSGTVAQVRVEEVETRNPATGASTIVITVRDENDLARTFLSIAATITAPKIRYLPPPLGTDEFLMPSGIGQVFALLQIERTINWQRTFENDPAGTGTGTLVDFTGLPTIPMQPDGTETSRVVERETFLVEFVITAGPPANTACVVDIYDVSAAFTNQRTGSGFTLAHLVHDYDAIADSIVGPVQAPENAHGVVAPVGPDASPSNPVADGDVVHLANGVIRGGIAGYNPSWTDNEVDTAGGAMLITNDGVGNPTDGDFDGVLTFSIDGQLDIAGFPGGLGNGIVEVSVLTLDSGQVEDPTMLVIDHPVDDMGLFLYVPVVAVTETGLIIYR